MSHKKHDVCIIGGLGRAGLPLGISLADAGKKVVLYDINEAAAKTVASGKMPFMEKDAGPALERVIGKTLFVSTQKDSIREARFVVIIIGTPVDRYLNPKFLDFKSFFHDVLPCFDDGQHLILRSTIYPGTTARVKAWLEAAGKKTAVSFCPERIAEGKAMEELKSLPQIVAGVDDDATREAGELFSTLAKEIIPLSPVEAEIAKLCLNSWRYLQFAVANQFYQIATANNVDFYRILDAITHNYPRASSFPRAGLAAGPCLFKDTMQLASYSENSFFLGHAAMLVNEGLPNFIAERLKSRMALSDKVVGILGMAFKGNSDDPRDSLAYKLRKIFIIEAKGTLCSDPFVKDPEFVSAETLMEKSDIIILAAPHEKYRALRIDPVKKTLVDVWNFFGRGGLF
jgi:UDP-N-acetyl-D-mannosaminuronic acid dehydrogenase